MSLRSPGSRQPSKTPWQSFSPCRAQGHHSETPGTWLWPRHHTLLLSLVATLDYFLFWRMKSVPPTHTHTLTLHTQGVWQWQGVKLKPGAASWGARGHCCRSAEQLRKAGDRGEKAADDYSH